MTDRPPAKVPLLTATPVMVRTAIEQLENHQPILRNGKSVCRRCCQPWTCPIHLHAEEIVLAAGLHLPDFDTCEIQPAEHGPVQPDTTQPRPKSHRRSPQPQQRLQLPAGASLTITPVGTAASRLPRIRPD